MIIKTKNRSIGPGMLPTLIVAMIILFPAAAVPGDRQNQKTSPTAQYAPVEKTGQKASFAIGDDGNLQKGVAWPNPRFTDNGDGTVTDNLTALVWMKNAVCLGKMDWNSALNSCNTLAARGACNLTDGSKAGSWRLPNIKELLSLIDISHRNAALPGGHPFNRPRSYYYWSSSTYIDAKEYAWGVDLGDGYVNRLSYDGPHFVWCVRDSQ